MRLSRLLPRTQPWQFLVLFFSSAAVIFSVLHLRIVEPMILGWDVLLTRMAAGLIRCFGGSAVAWRTSLYSLHIGFVGVEVAQECNGFDVVAFVWAAVIASPVSSRTKLKGLLITMLTAEALNLLRIAALFLLGERNFGRFDVMHTIASWSLAGLTGAVYCLWAWKSVQMGRPDGECRANAQTGN